jgi:hypothetical protein
MKNLLCASAAIPRLKIAGGGRSNDFVSKVDRTLASRVKDALERRIGIRLSNRVAIDKALEEWLRQEMEKNHATN